MAIRAIEDANQSQVAAASNQLGSAADLGKDQFLKLLVTQMQHQDPLNPMDNAEFTAQLAQFSSLEQLFQVNTNLTGLVDSQAPAGMASVAGFIDREILALGDATEVSGDGVTPLQFYLDGPAEIVNAVVHDPDGNAVRTLPLGRLPGGDREVAWDGLDDNGQPLPAATYRFSILAQDTEGDSVAVRTQVVGRVTGAVYDGDTPELVVGSRRIPLTDVLAVRPAATATGG
jgi:flagellar basal-body rod modification protein FlgD